MYRLIMLLCITLFFVSCIGPDKLSTLERINNLVTFKKNAINLHYVSVRELNFFESNTHSLNFTIYQLNDVNNFKFLIKDPAELGKLMVGMKFDNTVLSFEQFTINPNKDDFITLDRVKGAKWVVLLAGYYNYDIKDDVYLVYPLILKEKSWYKFLENKIEYSNLDIHLQFDKNKLIEEVQK